MSKHPLHMLLIGLFLFIINSSASNKQSEQTVLSIPTTDIIQHMLDIANVNSGDTLFDIGSQNGDLAINAAKKYGAYSIGIGLVSTRIESFLTQAQEALVEDLVRLVKTKPLDTDMHDATVVALYLTPNENIALRPKLFGELKPGTRVVSRNSNMGEWKPDRISRIDDEFVYYWRIPANVSGVWEWEIEHNEYKVLVTQRFQKTEISPLSGKSLYDIEMTVRGKQVELLLFLSQSESCTYTGTIEGDEIKGFVSTPAGNWFPWAAERIKDTSRPISEASDTDNGRS